MVTRWLLDINLKRENDENKLLKDDTLPERYDKVTKDIDAPRENEVVDTNIPLLTIREILALNLSFFGLNLLLLVLSIQIVPAQIVILVGSKMKATLLGALVGLGAIITLITGPTVGMFSDRLRTRFGRRRPLIVGFSVVLTIGLLGMASSAPDLHSLTPSVKNNTNSFRNGTICNVNLEWRRCRPYYSNSSPYWNEFYERHKSRIILQQAQKTIPPNQETKRGYTALFFIFYCIMVFGYVGTLTPYHALVADRSHPAQRGICSGVLGGMILLGNISGAAMGLLVSPIGVTLVYVISIIIMLACIIVTIGTIAELPISEKLDPPLSCTKAIQGYWKPFQNHNFRWVFITRFLMQMGLTSTVGFIEFWLHDMIPLPYCWSPIRGVSFMLIPLLILAAISSILCGILSDQLHIRKSIVMAASFIMCVCDVLMAGLQGNLAYYIAIGLAIIFGFAFGSYQAVDFALLMDVLPDPEEKSRDIAVWQQAMNLSQALAVPTAGIILDSFQRVNCHIGLGYILMFVIGGFYFLLSGILMTKVRL